MIKLELSGRSSCHLHTTFSDGQAEPEAYAKRAKEMGLEQIGFSEHAPLFFPAGWSMRPKRLADYLGDIRRLKELYRGQLDVQLGLEVDFIPGRWGPSTFADKGLDYTIGAVHFLRVGEEWLEIDHTEEKLLRILREGFNGSVEAMVKAYYESIRDLLEIDPPDILAHLDLIKKFNRGLKLFREDERWYQWAVFDTLEALSGTKTILEVNTAPLYRGYADEPYPSRFILVKARMKEISVLITADAHWPEAMREKYTEALALIQSTRQ